MLQAQCHIINVVQYAHLRSPVIHIFSFQTCTIPTVLHYRLTITYLRYIKRGIKRKTACVSSFFLEICLWDLGRCLLWTHSCMCILSMKVFYQYNSAQYIYPQHRSANAWIPTARAVPFLWITVYNVFIQNTAWISKEKHA